MAGPLISPCFNISAYPDNKFSRDNVTKNCVEIITVKAGLNTPTSFFNPLKFIPVFPPTAASTAPNNVVGILIY